MRSNVWLTLFQCKASAAYNDTANLDFNAICADSQRAGTQIVNILTAIGSEVRARVGGIGFFFAALGGGLSHLLDVESAAAALRLQ